MAPAFASGSLGLLVKKVDSMPIIDGDASDPVWQGIPGVGNDQLLIRAVYDGSEMAMLFEMNAPTMSIHTPGNWVWTGQEWKTWTEVREETEFKAWRAWDWLAVIWEIEPFGMTEGGCAYTCHTVEGSASGRRHAFTEGQGTADLWVFLAKHAYGPRRIADSGWPLGVRGAYQEGPLTFASTDPRDPFKVTSGSVVFFGYAEERYQTSLNDPVYQTLETETTDYCSLCHDREWVKANSLQGDVGRMPYRRNGLTGPEYIQLNPVNFVDAMTLTEEEIANGLAVPVASLTPAEVARCWNNYVAVNATVPEVILQEPSGSQADVVEAARWNNGRWTVELRRALVTGNADDIQFDDLTKTYSMTVTASNGVPHEWAKRDFGQEVGISVTFER